ncbi:hypothetical protein NHX12_003818 [Muraenolepis orangiensis]|uniref:G-protein coupled receptors family 1 profile domain-containing protein n=1 Tax=Muraenolepis orangiensis TaxID=630683 RepID=A0A9Q0DVL4_9TELE|nr:hypothetical protein NHX12_003818 [Muraenolepis orangiensis]
MFLKKGIDFDYDYSQWNSTVCVISNGLLLRVLVIHKELKKVINLYIFNLACSDIVIMLSLSFTIADIIHLPVSRQIGDIGCKLERGAYRTGRISSTIFLTALSVDRFTTVVFYKWTINPVRRRWCTLGVCTVAWIVSISFGRFLQQESGTSRAYQL